MTSPRALTVRLARFLSLRVVLILAIGILAAVSFVELAEEVLEGEAEPVDRAISAWVRGHRSSALDRVMRGATQLGSVVALSAVVVLVSAWAVLRRRRRLAGLYVATALATGLLVGLLKVLFQRPRPDLRAAIAAPDAFSFPSGHAMSSLVVLGMGAFVVRRLTGWPARTVYGLMAPVVGLIGLSRVYLGVHWTTDVLAGYAGGAILLAAAGLASDRLR